MRRSKEFPQPERWWTHRVSYGETDAMGVVYYGNYLHWFERARSEFMRDIGMSYAEVEARGLYLPVSEAYCRYRAPARYEQIVAVRAGIGHWGRASLTFCYEVFNQSDHDRFMTEGWTKHACVDAHGKMVSVPSWLKELF